jgi:hypothetical protein
MNKPAKRKNLADLPKHVRDFKKVLGMYLDPKEAKQFFNPGYSIFQACGTGYDGERQYFSMRGNGTIFRAYVVSHKTKK